MGIIDIEHLIRINRKIQEIVKQHKLPFKFETDKGTYETAIEFYFLGEAKFPPYWEMFHPPRSLNWKTNPNILCPDLLDWHHKLVIEYEEEIGPPLPGAKLAKKGHQREGDIDNKRDKRRNDFYEHAHIHMLRIWESDKNWEEKLEQFLLNSHHLLINK